MAMPRYKYAIGNAPVRFPSAEPHERKEDAGQVETVNDAEAQGHPRLAPSNGDRSKDELRTNRWSLLSLVGMSTAEGDATSDGCVASRSLRKARSQQDLRLPAESRHNRRTSIQVDSGAAQSRGRHISLQSNAAHLAHLRSPARFDLSAPPKRQVTSVYRGLPYDAQARARPVSWILPGSSAGEASPISPGGSRSSSRASNVRPEPNEQSRLLNGSKSREMSQRHDSQSLRPSSLFWTDMGSKQRKYDAATRPRSSASYGSIMQSESRSANDPYGYRALAGPALLPVYHQEQQKIACEQSTGFGTTLISSAKSLLTHINPTIVCLGVAIAAGLTLVLQYFGLL